MWLSDRKLQNLARTVFGRHMTQHGTLDLAGLKGGGEKRKGQTAGLFYRLHTTHTHRPLERKDILKDGKSSSRLKFDISRAPLFHLCVRQ